MVVSEKVEGLDGGTLTGRLSPNWGQPLLPSRPPVILVACAAVSLLLSPLILLLPPFWPLWTLMVVVVVAVVENITSGAGWCGLTYATTHQY